jgi:N-acetylmuramic acid 6-phosphate etherase
MSSSRKLFEELSQLLTEQQNPNTIDIDERSAIEIARLINEEDKKSALSSRAMLA